MAETGRFITIRPVKRVKLMACGWAISVIAGLALLYQACDLVLAPTRYYATVFLTVNLGVPGGTEAHDALFAEPSLLHSPKILRPVIDALNLRTVWGHKFDRTDKLLMTDDALQILVARTTIYQAPNHPDTIQLDVYSDEPKEAVDIADSIAYTSRDYFQNKDRSSPVAFTDAGQAKISHSNLFIQIVKMIFTILFIGLGIVLIRWGRKYPPPASVGQTLETTPISTY